MNLDEIAGVTHEPAAGPAGRPKGVVVLTHGAGGNRESQLLQQEIGRASCRERVCMLV